jgi:hypothetical protein
LLNKAKPCPAVDSILLPPPPPPPQVGRTLTDDPEEEKAQKALKALLNKITPDNFERITQQAR